jgi:hypothetical protein
MRENRGEGKTCKCANVINLSFNNKHPNKGQPFSNGCPFFYFVCSEIIWSYSIEMMAILYYYVVRGGKRVFIKILTKTYGGKKHYYASLVENTRINNKVVQTVKANLGPVTEDQIPYLKAAYSKKKPKLVYDDD